MARSIADNQILEAALEVIVQEGYAGATTRQIAAAAGINEVTLFRRFGSKQNLLKAVIEQEAESFEAAGIEYTGELEADILRVVRFYQHLVQNQGRLIALMWSEIPRQPELLELMQTPLTIIKKVITMLERYQNEGKLVAEPPMQAFIALVGPLFMAVVLRTIQPGLLLEFDPDRQIQRFLRGRAIV